MLTISQNGYKTINSGSLSIGYLYEIFYGTPVYSATGGETYVDSEDQPCEPLRLTTFPEDVTYEGKLYEKAVISHESETQDSSGAITETSLQVGNYDQIIQSYISIYKLEGKKVLISTLVLDSLGAIVWTKGSEFRIKNISVKSDFASFTLSSGLDVLSITFPNRIARGLYCRWKFKESECKYSGADAICTLTWDDCFTKGNSANFGGFPGIINEKFYF